MPTVNGDITPRDNALAAASLSMISTRKSGEAMDESRQVRIKLDEEREQTMMILQII
jgi:hypothetical protein